MDRWPETSSVLSYTARSESICLKVDENTYLVPYYAATFHNRFVSIYLNDIWILSLFSA